MKKILLYVFLSLVSIVSSFAQPLTNYDRRQMNLRLLETITRYEEYSNFSEEHMLYSFQDLFSSSDAKVWCDYIAALNFGEKMSASEYAKYSSNTISVKFVEVRNLRKSDYRNNRGKYIVTVEFDKCIEYEDELHTYFTTTDEIFGGDYHIVMELEFNKMEDRFYILSIDGRANENSKFPPGDFYVIEKKNVRDDDLMFNGAPIKFNPFNEYICSSGSALPEIFDDDVVTNVLTVANAARYRKLHYSYKETRLRLRAGLSFAPVFAYKVKSQIPFSLQKSSAYEGSVDFGYAWSADRKSKIALYIGLGLSYSQLNLGVQDITYGYALSDDKLVTYNRLYQLDNVSEGLSFIDLMIPLYVSYEASFGKWLGLTVDAGFKLYLNTSTKVRPYSVTGNVSSIYSGETIISDFTRKIDQYMTPVSYMRNSYDAAVFGKVGCDAKVLRGKYIFIKVGYVHGLTQSYRSNMNQWCNPSEGVYPFVYSFKSQSDIAVRSFADCVSYRRSALTFDIGFRMKF